MKIEDVKEIINNMDDNDDISEFVLKEMFRAVYGRYPDQKDWDDDVFSLICAGIDTPTQPKEETP